MNKLFLYLRNGRGKYKKIFLVSVWVFLFILPGSSILRAETLTQLDRWVNIRMDDASLKEVLWEVEGQIPFSFIFNTEDLDKVGKVSVNIHANTVEKIVEECLKQTDLTYVIQDDVIVIKPAQAQRQAQSAQQGVAVARGKVVDSNGNPLAGVTVILAGTQSGTITDQDGTFQLSLPQQTGTLQFSFIGKKTVNVQFTGQDTISVRMEDDSIMMQAAVVSTGMFRRDINTFTGSFASFTGEELKNVSTQSPLAALRSLDPSFRITDNNLYGSDPNRMPDIDIRGKASIVNMDDLENTFGMDPNSPLFILDDFEVSLQTVIDLDIERIDQMFVLKDASATAMYGSRAANGVIVIQTKRPKPGKLNVAYGGTLTLNVPDLSDYNMMNAREKLDFEWKSGWYTTSQASQYYPRLSYLELYNKRKAWVESGVDSYWLNEPVRTGVTHKHSVSMSGGSEAMYYQAGLNYSNTEGAMKQSSREVLGFNVDLHYRVSKFSFVNTFSFENLKEINPPVTFDKYVRTNPYYPKNSTQKYLDEYRIADLNNNYTYYDIKNPLYDANQNYLDDARTYTFRDNIQLEYRFSNALRLTGRLGFTKAMKTAEVFESPFLTKFDDTARTERGSYVKKTVDQFAYNADMSLIYGQSFNRVHSINAMARVEMRSSKTKSDAYEAIGFTSDRIPNPAFANEYATDSKPTYKETLSRSVAFIANVNYNYDQRYAIDINLRSDGTTNFGKNKKFTTTYSVGLAWNLHNEKFVGDWANMLKLRASVGNPGNNQVDYDTFLTYIYNTTYQNHFGVGANVYDFGNSNLDWQKTLNYTVGMDVAVLKNRLSLTFDVYRKVTDPLLVDVDIAPSTGRTSFITNLGKSTINGYDFTVAGKVIERERLGWTVSLNGGYRKTKYSDIGNSLNSLNESLIETSLKRYRDGGSPDDVWAVRSAGIDPTTGDEVFIKKDGSYTFIYDSADEVIIGSTNPDLTGTIGTMLYWKGLSVSAYFRYSFGGQHYNTELHDRIENITRAKVNEYNQDKRALYDRWEKAGDRKRYVNIVVPGDRGTAYTYPMTSRYLQKNNFFAGESVSVSYTFRQEPWLDKLYLASMKFGVTMNDIFRFSTVRAERGIYSPYARVISFSLNLTFK